MTVGERIKQRRIELHMSQDDLAQRLGYKSRTSVCRFENARDLPITKVAEMATALSVDPAYLMGWDDFKPEINIPDDTAQMIKIFESLTDQDKATLMATAKAMKSHYK